MVANAFFLSTLILMVLAIYLLQECQFLIPYKTLLVHKYSHPIAVYVVFLFINLFAAIYSIGRKVFLKDTGRKLAHLEKQLRTGPSISEELSERLKE